MGSLVHSDSQFPAADLRPMVARGLQQTKHISAEELGQVMCHCGHSRMCIGAGNTYFRRPWVQVLLLRVFMKSPDFDGIGDTEIHFKVLLALSCLFLLRITSKKQ